MYSLVSSNCSILCSISFRFHVSFLSLLFGNLPGHRLEKNNAECKFLMILSSHWKGTLSSVVTWLHCVSKLTSHSYNNPCLVKNCFFFTEKKKTFTVFKLLLLCFSNIWSNSDSWKANPKGCASRKGSRIVTVCVKHKQTGTNRI